jgi:predicted RNase H-like HicB family nuclease
MDRHASAPQNGRMITFKIEKDIRGFHAWSPELPGVHTHGTSRAQALANLKDAVRLYLNDVNR